MTGSWENDEDDFLFEDEEETTPTVDKNDPWVMLIVDDEQGIHDVTKLALKRFSYEGRPLELLSAYSGEEAISILRKRNDVAVVLLDVVMETDHAGLDCVHQIRNELDNESIRIVLRTGQPGQAPETDVILAYDINDYRAKTELSTTRLFTTVVSALRNYRDILALKQYRDDAYGLLAQNTQSLQSLIDFSDLALFQFGEDLYLQRCNVSFAGVFKEEVKNLVGLQALEFAPRSFHDQLINAKDGLLELNGQYYRLTIAKGNQAISGSLKAEAS